MLSPEDLSAKLKHNFVLFDTCVLIESFEDQDAFLDFFNFVSDAICQPVYFPFIQFEFQRNAFLPENMDARKQFVDILGVEHLAMNPMDKLVTDAMSIANVYARQKHNGVELVDCCTASFMKRYPDKLFLVTLNHKDFPPFLFDCVAIYPVETKRKMLPVGFYKYNNEKARKIKL